MIAGMVRRACHIGASVAKLIAAASAAVALRRAVAELITAASAAVALRRAVAELITAASAAVALRQGTCIRCGGVVFEDKLICPACLDDAPQSADQPAGSS
jgi:hypothetical protein